MSVATKRKYVVKELFEMSRPTASQHIVRITAARGNHLYEVVTPTGEQYLVSMPNKFRQTIWVKRNDYIVIEPVEEGNKVKGEIVKILTKEHITWYRTQNCWPSEFDEDLKRKGHSIMTNYTACTDEDLFVNTNRRYADDSSETSSSCSSSSDHEFDPEP
ncbi:hypothetical protein DMN91_011595 [Ooceraea biroi]|uniref:Probable RNA-binding protein EIF1AD n=1 Tax=Ooceraea biroi TaxID=2015173 RepID=A0A026W1G6_OOCBI|nr:probable RNA-binding protein EIF1AD [Ooceraea biroi]EZA49915.1 putative RNA-binding protein EIF1AD [Ooceraea biroi]RLU15839.1 hypothetical protein DMN91_011595 [Ooceraea biroi]